ncbi:MAG: TerC/Alx family metal homeostasis membrane protein [Bacteroidia bacterium]|nr:TerC/Alx family metal homeostasis membrane protein [Bacteroidia bacterium]
MISNELIFFTLFCIFILGILFFDLKVVGKNSHVVSFKESLLWTSVWVTFAIGFYFLIFFFGDNIHGIQNQEHLNTVTQKYAQHIAFTDDFNNNLSLYRHKISTEYITGYLIEYSLSIDNIFVIMMILAAFSVEEKYFKRVLFWGILGAILLRFTFIFAGAALIQKFEWILYIFGAFLVYSGAKMFIYRNKNEKIEPQNHILVKFLSKRFPVHPRYEEDKFIYKIDKKKFITPLLLVLVLVEFTDLIFALDSIPAIFAITRDPYIVFFSNIFAILGLRSLFFLLSKMIDKFIYLKIGIAFLLFFIGFKLLFRHWLDQIGFETAYSLYIIIATLFISIFASVFKSKKPLKLNKS